MSIERLTAKDSAYVLVCIAPDVCKTPIGSSTPPVPYPITHQMDQSEHCSPNVFINGEPAFLHGESYVDNVKGDMPGVAGGIMSKVNQKVSHSDTHSKTVYINGKPAVRTGDRVHMNTKKP